MTVDISIKLENYILTCHFGLHVDEREDKEDNGQKKFHFD